MMIYLLVPLYPLLASLGLGLIPPRSQAHPHVQPVWSPVRGLLSHVGSMASIYSSHFHLGGFYALCLLEPLSTPNHPCSTWGRSAQDP